MLCSLILAATLAQPVCDSARGVFSVTFDEKTGGAQALVFKDDPARMNWIEGARKWGTINDFTQGEMVPLADFHGV